MHWIMKMQKRPINVLKCSFVTILWLSVWVGSARHQRPNVCYIVWNEGTKPHIWLSIAHLFRDRTCSGAWQYSCIWNTYYCQIWRHCAQPAVVWPEVASDHQLHTCSVMSTPAMVMSSSTHHHTSWEITVYILELFTRPRNSFLLNAFNFCWNVLKMIVVSKTTEEHIVCWWYVRQVAAWQLFIVQVDTSHVSSVNHQSVFRESLQSAVTAVINKAKTEEKTLNFLSKEAKVVFSLWLKSFKKIYFKIHQMLFLDKNYCTRFLALLTNILHIYQNRFQQKN